MKPQAFGRHCAIFDEWDEEDDGEVDWIGWPSL